MIPGTTPTFVLTLKNAPSYLQNTVDLRVDIRQQDVIVRKYKDDLTFSFANNSIGITLTQKESMQFMYKKGAIEFQVHGLLNDGTAWKTYVVDVPIHKTLTREYMDESKIGTLDLPK